MVRSMSYEFEFCGLNANRAQQQVGRTLKSKYLCLKMTIIATQYFGSTPRGTGNNYDINFQQPPRVCPTVVKANCALGG